MSWLRRPRKKDFEGKTIKRFKRDADNVWHFEFTDGTKIEVWSEMMGWPSLPLLGIPKKSD